MGNFKKNAIYRKFLRPIKHFFGYILFGVIILKIRVFPRKLWLFLASYLGKLAFLIFRKSRNIALSNLEMAFPKMSEKERISIAKESFINSARNTIDIVKAAQILNSKEPLFEIIDEKYLIEYKNNFGGGIVITGHIGAFELIPGIWVLRGYKVAVVGRRLYDERIDRMLIKQRERMGVVNIPSDSHPKRIIDLARDGYFIGTLMDTFTKSVVGRTAPFFGHPVRTISAPVLISRLMKRPLLPMCIFREREKHILRVFPPVNIPITDNKDSDIEIGLKLANKCIEMMIREHPEQWIWFHERFKE